MAFSVVQERSGNKRIIVIPNPKVARSNRAGVTNHLVRPGPSDMGMNCRRCLLIAAQCVRLSVRFERSVYDVMEGVEINWFANCVDDIDLMGTCELGGRLQKFPFGTANQDDRNLRLYALQRQQEFDAIEFWHVEIA